MSATEAGRSFGADTSKDKNKQEVVGAESKQETKDVPKKSYEDIGKEKREAVMASGKKAWEGLKDKLSGGAKWLKE